MFERRKIMTKKQNYIWRNDRNFALDEYEGSVAKFENQTRPF